MESHSAFFSGLALAVLLAAGVATMAQEQPPPPKAYLPDATERADLDTKKSALTRRLAELRSAGITEERVADAGVYLHTAELADQLYLYTKAAEVRTALRGLDQGLERCDALAKGESPWRTRPGSTLRGYVSRIDGSVQPYRVVLPAEFDPEKTYRLDLVLHGRGPTELTFLEGNGSARTPGGVAGVPFIELYPFGRGNNAFRWAGETDVFEALAAVRAQYKVDPNRVILRGFSMGGHGAWHLGVHHPGEWAGVSPGAGFTETRNYLGLGDDVPEYQVRAWHLYDAVDYAYNLFGTPFVGYGGEEDKQLQATLNMRAAAEKKGAPLEVVIGPKTGHAYQPDSFRKIMTLLAATPRDPHPRRVRFATWSLKWNRRAWVAIDGMGEEYRRALVDADATRTPATVRTENVSALSLNLGDVDARTVTVDGEAFDAPANAPLRLERAEGHWRRAGKASTGLRKRHRLQGPIDDAFTERFLVVRGTGEAWSPELRAYADGELARFRDVWRFGFRGELPVKDDTAVTENDWRDANLLLLGDPGSNRLLARVLPKLPVQWSRTGLKVAGKQYGPDCVPVLIFPNPLNPNRYVVVNTGHTFTLRDLHRSNAYQTPKLGDWAVLKPGAAGNEVLAAGFFDESWRLPAATPAPALR